MAYNRILKIFYTTIIFVAFIYTLNLHVAKINFDSLFPVFKKGNYALKLHYFIDIKKGDYVCYSPVVNDKLISLLFYINNINFKEITFSGLVIGVEGDFVEDKKEFVVVGLNNYRFINYKDTENLERIKFQKINTKVLIPKDNVYVLTSDFNSIDSRHIGYIDIESIKFKIFPLSPRKNPCHGVNTAKLRDFHR